MAKVYTDNNIRSFIRSNLRKLWLISPARLNALLAAETAIPKLDKDGKHMVRNYKAKGKKPARTIQLYTRTYTCKYCGKSGMKNCKEEMSIDHFYPVGPTPGLPSTPDFWTWDIFITRLLWPVWVDALCKECHAVKTIEDKRLMRDEKHLKEIAKVFSELTDK